jgi:hypothetical protein
MKKVVRKILSVLAIVTFVAAGTAGAAASKCTNTGTTVGTQFTPDRGAGDYGVMN